MALAELISHLLASGSLLETVNADDLGGSLVRYLMVQSMSGLRGSSTRAASSTADDT